MDLYRELRQAALASAPAFTLPAALLLGLGLGSAIAVFSVDRVSPGNRPNMTSKR